MSECVDCGFVCFEFVVCLYECGGFGFVYE